MGPAVPGSARLARAVVAGMWPAAFGFGLLSLLIARSHPGATFGGSSWTAGLAELAAGWAVIGAGCMSGGGGSGPGCFWPQPGWPGSSPNGTTPG